MTLVLEEISPHAVLARIDGMTWLRVYTAASALLMPSKFYGAHATHKQCRSIIREAMGYCPKGKPESLAAVYEWLGVLDLHHRRASDNGVRTGDVTRLALDPKPVAEAIFG